MIKIKLQLKTFLWSCSQSEKAKNKKLGFYLKQSALKKQIIKVHTFFSLPFPVVLAVVLLLRSHVIPLYTALCALLQLPALQTLHWQQPIKLSFLRNLALYEKHLGPAASMIYLPLFAYLSNGNMFCLSQHFRLRKNEGKSICTGSLTNVTL